MTSPSKTLRSLGGAALLAVGLLVIVAFGPVSGARAAQTTFALKPVPQTESGYFVFAGKPGQTVRGKFEVANVGTKAGSTRLYAVDATTGQTSGAVYQSRGEAKKTIGRWTDFSTSSVSLNPGQSQLVSFSVHVPDGAEPGQYLGGIVAQRFTKTVTSYGAEGGGGGGKSEDGGFQVKVQALSVLAIQVDVPGSQRPEMSLTGVKPGGTPGQQALLLGIRNGGNVLVKGSGSLVVKNQAGRKVQDQQFALDTFVPDTAIEFPVYVKGRALAPGRYRATVSISYRGRQATRSFPFRITSKDTQQVFGTNASQTLPPASASPSSSDNTLVYVLFAVCLLSLATAFYFWRNRRPA